MNKLLFILPIFFFATAYGGIVNHVNCVHARPGPGPAPTWVYVDGCEGASCSVRNGTEAFVQAGFTPTYTHHSLRFHLGVYLLGISIPIEQPEAGENACLLLDGGCPLIAGAGERSFTYRFSISSPIVGPTVLIELNLIDSDTEESVACAGVSVTITA
uniref:Putative ml domain protein n=1 Tax=Lutzomyia longipalpis TaxID=7200 RepID=A0A7G3APS0_LUTLO